MRGAPRRPPGGEPRGYTPAPFPAVIASAHGRRSVSRPRLQAITRGPQAKPEHAHGRDTPPPGPSAARDRRHDLHFDHTPASQRTQPGHYPSQPPPAGRGPTSPSSPPRAPSNVAPPEPLAELFAPSPSHPPPVAGASFPPPPVAAASYPPPPTVDDSFAPPPVTERHFSAPPPARFSAPPAGVGPRGYPPNVRVAPPATHEPPPARSPSFPPHFRAPAYGAPVTTARAEMSLRAERAGSALDTDALPVGPVAPAQILAASAMLGLPLALATLVVAVLALR